MMDALHHPTFRSPAAQMLNAQKACRLLFETAPISLLVLTPELRIIDANDSYLADVAMERDALASMSMFEVFPDSPHDLRADGVRNLQASFDAVMHTGRADVMPLQRYDIKPQRRPWEVRYWHPKNWAMIDEGGSVLALVHHVRDVTREILAQREMSSRASIGDLLRRADVAIQDSREIMSLARKDREVSKALTRQVLRQKPYT